MHCRDPASRLGWNSEPCELLRPHQCSFAKPATHRQDLAQQGGGEQGGMLDDNHVTLIFVGDVQLIQQLMGRLAHLQHRVEAYKATLATSSAGMTAARYLLDKAGAEGIYICGTQRCHVKSYMARPANWNANDRQDAQD